MSTPIDGIKYQYTYGAGSCPNREIEFKKLVETDPATIYIEVFAISCGERKKIGFLEGKDITVEMQSTREKVRDLQAARLRNTPYQAPSDKSLSQLSIDEQNNILKNFEPIGSWRVSIVNDINRDDLSVEKVKRISIFNAG